MVGFNFLSWFFNEGDIVKIDDGHANGRRGWKIGEMWVRIRGDAHIYNLQVEPLNKEDSSRDSSLDDYYGIYYHEIIDYRVEKENE